MELTRDGGLSSPPGAPSTCLLGVVQPLRYHVLMSVTLHNGGNWDVLDVPVIFPRVRESSFSHYPVYMYTKNILIKK